MDPLVLSTQLPTGELLEATFLPACGMNMISFKRGSLEVIDQSTKDQFEERFAGLGALIGPHFHRKHASVVPRVAKEELFPHIARVKAKGVTDPFSHGIARYAPWTVLESSATKVVALIAGKDRWNDVPLSELEGQDFKMKFAAELTAKGLFIDFSVVSSSDSVVGLHYYYHLPQGRGTVISRVQSHCLDCGRPSHVTDLIEVDSRRQMSFQLNHSVDCAFYPYPDPCAGEILLDAESYQLKINYQAPSQESCWNLFHPQGSSYVCIEPLSAQDPRHPNLTVSSFQTQLQIL